MTSKQCIFLTGHRKSGTSVFHKLLDSSPYIHTIPIDLSLFYAYYQVRDRFESDNAHINRITAVVRRGFEPLDGEKLNDSEVYFSVNRFIEAILSKINLTKLSRAMLLDAILDAWYEVNSLDERKPIVVKETSQAIFYNEFLQSQYDIFFLNLIRDPRDNYAAIKAGISGYYETFGESETLALASVLDRVYVDLEASIIHSRLYPNKFKIIRFEDLAENTDEVMHGVEIFANIPASEKHRVPTVNGAQYTGNSHEGKVFVGVSTENIGAWKKRITKAESSVIEFKLAGIMAKFGYICESDELSRTSEYADFYDRYNPLIFFKDSFQK